MKQELTEEQQEEKLRVKHAARMEVLAVALILTVKDCRLLLGGISQAFIYQLLNSGAIRSFKIGDRRMVSREALNEYIDDLDNKSKHTLESGVI